MRIHRVSSRIQEYVSPRVFDDDNHSMDYYRQITKSVDSTTWQFLINQKVDLNVLIGAASGPFLDPLVGPVRSLNQYDTYFIVDGMASGYIKNAVAAVPSGFTFDSDATTALSPVSITGVPVFDGFNKPINAPLGTDADVLSAKALDKFNVIYGGKGDDVIIGSTFGEILIGGAGNDTIDGGVGIDTVAFSGPRASYSISKSATGWTVFDNTGKDGTDTLKNVERLKFSDGYVALDVSPTQSTGMTQLLLGAVLGKDLLATKKPLIGDVVKLFDSGLYSMQVLSGALMRLDIWGLLANGGQPGATNTHIANYLLTTVNKATPDPVTLSAAVTALNTETSTAQGNFLWHLAESPANQVQVGLVGLATTGLEF